MLTIGLTGGIGSGKSTVAELFRDYGVTIIDSDIIARDVVAPGTALLTEILKHFSNEILDNEGSLDRRQLRDIIFNNNKERLWLEKHLHPAIYTRIREQLTTIKSPYSIVIIPLLVETKPLDLIDRILVVDCPEDLQINRVQKRDNTNDNKIKSIMQTQVSREDRLAAADDIIDNSGDLESLKQQVHELHQDYLELSKNS